REAAILAAVQHPYIMTPRIISHADGRKYMISPWADNGTLRNYLDKKRDPNRLRLLSEVASALHYLHTLPNPIIHGDIYIDNVLVSEYEQALLTDFGLSTVVSSTTSGSEIIEDGKENYFLGRVSYMAPELHDDGAARTRETDVFAFGMLMFHVYAGRPPFSKSDNPNAVIIAMYEGQRPSREEIPGDDVSDGLWELMQACWSPDPKGRPTM
ncbi:kinase-like protein, partial [Auricularia subglabra TFB-10046 SS5]